MIILGIDPGLAITGYGIIEKKGSKFRCLDVGVITTKSTEPFENRLLSNFEQLFTIINHYDIDEVAIEKLFFNNNSKTAIDVAQSRGVLILAAKKHNLPIAEYTPPEIKLAVSGYGKAIKSQVQYMVKQLLNLESTPKPDDAADALAVAIAHAHCHRVKFIQ